MAAGSAAYQKERYEFIERMFAGVDSIPIQQVIGNYINLVQRGRHFMGLCPFHHDTRLGSFVVTPDKGIWKCFTCGDEYAGNAAKFVSLYKTIPYLDAVFDIALQYGVITPVQYDKYAKKKYDDAFVKKLEKRYSDKAKDEEKPVKAAPEVIHNVYLLIQMLCPLSEEHRAKLENERVLPEDRIKKDYFTFPINWRQKDKIISEIKSRFPKITDAILQTVPGFFYDKSRGKISFAGYKGLGILIRNQDGVISGIQIRKDTIKDGDSRYVWFSSSFAFYRKDEFAGGCGCGSPKDVLWAKDRSRKTLCITEGRFKSEVLSAQGNTTISIQGVSSWSGIDSSIRAVCRMQDIKCIYVFLDSDILGKHMLFLQSEKMCMFLAQQFPHITIKYAFWNKEKGKGIDDYIHNNGDIKKISYISVSEASRIAKDGFLKTLKKYGVERLMDLRQEDAASFEEDLQNLLESRILKKTR